MAFNLNGHTGILPKPLRLARQNFTAFWCQVGLVDEEVDAVAHIGFEIFDAAGGNIAGTCTNTAAALPASRSGVFFFEQAARAKKQLIRAAVLKPAERVIIKSHSFNQPCTRPAKWPRVRFALR